MLTTAFPAYTAYCSTKGFPKVSGFRTGKPPLSPSINRNMPLSTLWHVCISTTILKMENSITKHQNIIENSMSRLNNTRPGKRKIRRSVWMPALLFIYLFGMTAWFAPTLIANGEMLRLIIVFVSEVAIILLLRVFLIKRERQEK